MSDFVSSFWSSYIAVITLVGIIGVGLFVWIVTAGQTPVKGKAEVTGHVWDEDLVELNNPLPDWWRWLFYISVVFALGYLVLYPGLGSFKGLLGWTSHKEYREEVAAAEKQYEPLFDKYMKQDIKVLAANPEARQIGQHLFLTYCSQCHGSDAGGATGFPNLRDNDWLYGGTPEAIQTTILNGRSGMMPPFGPILGPEKVKEVANYVLSLSGAKHNAEEAKEGKAIFATNCAACHGPTGTGNQMIGAPDLADNIWLYGGSEKDVEETISKGRRGVMPAQKDALGEAKVHLLAAYVYSLSH